MRKMTMSMYPVLMAAATLYGMQAFAVDFVEAAPKQTKVLVDNDKVRVIRASFQEGRQSSDAFASGNRGVHTEVRKNKIHQRGRESH